MEKYNAQQVMNGNWGEIWIDGTYILKLGLIRYCRIEEDITDVINR